MQTEQRFHGDALVVRLTGDLDLASAPAVREELEAALDRTGARLLVLNLAGCTFIDSSGLGLIYGRYRRLRGVGGAMALVAPHAAGRHTLEVGGVFDLIPVYESEEAALGGRGGAVGAR